LSISVNVSSSDVVSPTPVSTISNWTYLFYSVDLTNNLIPPLKVNF